MEQPDRFGSFLLFQQCDSNAFRTSYRAGITRGQAIDRIVRLEVYDGDRIDARQLLVELPKAQQTQSRLEDPHIARGIDVGQVGGVPYVAYDFEIGTTLSTFLEAARNNSFPVPFDQALFIAERIALALAAAHRAGTPGDPLSHSFLTPDSVLLTNEGEIKVLGFEFAQAIHAQLASDIEYAPYLSPETRAGQSRSASDDVFSLGSILFELVAGEPLPETPDFAGLVIQATGEPAPEGLRRLLETSVAPSAGRLPHVMAWQQTLGRLILDGEHNPTTFNLAFMMHTILRTDLERDATNLRREKNYLLREEVVPSVPSAPNPPVEEASEVSEPGSTALPEESAPVELAPTSPETEAVTAESSGSEWRVVVDPTTTDRKPFWLGFCLSALGAGALLAAFWPFDSPTNTEPEPFALAARTEIVTELPESAPPTGEVAAEQAAFEAPTEPQVVRTEIVHQETEQNPETATSPEEPAGVNPEELEQLLSERALAIERALKAEYDKKLESLRSEIQEPALDGTTAVAPPATGAPSAQPELSRRVADTETERETPVALSAGAGQPGGATSPGDEKRTEPAEIATTEARVPERSESPGSSGAGPAPPEPAAQVLVPASKPAAALNPARLLRLGTPAYPAAARKLGLTAQVKLKALVGVDGRVKQAEIVGPEVGSGFDFSALAAVRKSRWEPATRGEQAVETWATLTIEFQP